MKLVRLFICVFGILFSLTCLGGTREVVSLSGDSWKLWRDAQVKWQKEKLCFTYDEALCLPIACPTKGWSILTSSEAMNVNVPGTAEEYLQKVSGPEGDIVGVTWWSRFMHIPYFSKGEKVFLCFSSIRSRAEIFINQELVGYQIVEKYREPKTNRYELVVYFSGQYNTINYQDIIELLEITVESKQATE